MFVIDTYLRSSQTTWKKKRKGIIIIIFYDVPTTRVIREISISANCRLIVSPLPATAVVRATHPLQTSPRTICSAIKHTLTLQKVLSRFLGLQRKPFRSRSVAIINIKTKIVNCPSNTTIYRYVVYVYLCMGYLKIFTSRKCTDLSMKPSRAKSGVLKLYVPKVFAPTL